MPSLSNVLTTTPFLFLIVLFIISALISAQQYDGYVVSQIHLAQGKTSSVMSVQWATSSDAASEVFVSLSQDGKNPSLFKGDSESYSFNYPGAAPYTSPILHSVTLTGLSPRTTYYYQCGDSKNGVLSGWLSFTTMPAPGDDSAPLSFALIGDLGTTNDSMSTISHILANPNFSMVLHAGDLSYADCNAPKWDLYGVMVTPLASGLPWMVGPGNHEIELIAGAEGGDLYRAFNARYKIPAQVKASELGKITYGMGSTGCCPSSFQSEYNYGGSFYSFEAGMVHVIYANAYSTSDPNSAQYQFIANDLSSVDRKITPWVVIVLHCPWYNSNKDHHDEWQTVQMRENMEQLWMQHNVNAVFAGHVHAYERSHPVYMNETSEKGITYINIGDAGNAEGHSSRYFEPQPDWSAFRNGTQYGHGELVVINSTHARWMWHRNVDGEKVTRDDISLCNSATFGTSVC